MKLIITQPELTEIVRKHIGETVQFAEGSDLVIEFTATRGDDGITATIDIPYMGLSSLDLSPGTVPAGPIKRAAKVGPVTRATDAVANKVDAPFATNDEDAIANDPVAQETEIEDEVANEVVAEEVPAKPATGLFAKS